MTQLQTFLLYLLAINILAFLAFGIDKRKARKGQWRTPESTLLALAAIGGSMGAWVGMKVWHHKTLHPKFKYGIPAIFIIQVFLLIFICLDR